VTFVELESRPAAVPPGTAGADLGAVDLAGLRRRVDAAGPADVERALAAAPGKRTMADFAALLAPAAGARLEDMARAAHELTVRRFGRTVRLFAPLYLSNECVSTCTYCGFSAPNRIARRTLAVEEAVEEATALARLGFRHLLLVSGEHARIVSKDDLVSVAAALAPIVPELSVVVQVWD
jgi:2-iminoacetate synthase